MIFQLCFTLESMIYKRIIRVAANDLWSLPCRTYAQGGHGDLGDLE